MGTVDEQPGVNVSDGSYEKSNAEMSAERERRHTIPGADNESNTLGLLVDGRLSQLPGGSSGDLLRGSPFGDMSVGLVDLSLERVQLGGDGLEWRTAKVLDERLF